jgi:glutaconate CoA-transferase subunit B
MSDKGEIQTVAAARLLRDKRSVFIGVGRPSTAAILARMVHNPELVLFYESGTIGAKPHRVPLSIGDGELAETADAVVSVPEMFNYWIGPGRIQVAFLGAAQVDRHANLNSTVIGDYEHPKTRLPGAGGAPEIALGCPEVVVIAPHSPRTFVGELDFRTTSGAHTTAVISSCSRSCTRASRSSRCRRRRAGRCASPTSCARPRSRRTRSSARCASW